MAHGSDTDGLPQSPIRPTRRQVRQACDACRVRKVRCATSGEASNQLTSLQPDKTDRITGPSIWLSKMCYAQVALHIFATSET